MVRIGSKYKNVTLYISVKFALKHPKEGKIE